MQNEQYFQPILQSYMDTRDVFINELLIVTLNYSVPKGKAVQF